LLRFLRTQTLRRQLFALAVALIVPFAALITWSAERTIAEREEELRDEAGSVAATAGQYLTQYLSSVDSLAHALSLNPDVLRLQRDASDRLFAAVLSNQPLLLNIVLSDKSGVIKGSGLAARTNPTLTVALPYVMDVVASGKPVVSDLVTGASSGKPTIIIAYPVFDADRLVGVIGIGLDVVHLQSLFKGVPLPEGSVITLTDVKSRVLARSLDAERYIGRYSEAHPASPKDVPRTQVHMSLDGIERFYGNASIERGPWLLSVGIPTSVARARLTPLWRRTMTVSIAAVVTFLLVALWLSHVLSHGVDRLRVAVQRIAEGDLSPPVRSPLPNFELAQLQDSFITMAANLRDAHTALDRQIDQERKVRESLQSLQRQIVRQERLAAVGVLVSGVAHELNNPLQAILGTVELLERTPNIPPDVLEEIDLIRTQSGRASEIIRNLSRFSSQQPGPPSLVNLCDVVAEVAQLRRRNLEDCEITLDIEPASTRKVYANFTEVEQVTLNFVINAEQAIGATGRNKGRILIRVFDTVKRVRLEVQDDGPGVAAQDEPKLFQPFFTTKPVGKGTGLGLSVSYGIIDSYGGTIGQHSNEWGGATFFFELPIADAAEESAKSDDQPPVLQRPQPSRF
jgi:C4-dicarboxylate-specific signal transduction histidine kinase